MSGFNVDPKISLEEALVVYDTRTQQVTNTLAQKGIVIPTMPQYQTQAGQVTYRGELPSNLTTLTDDQLGTYMGLLSEWGMYIQFQLAEADSQLLNAKAKLAQVEAQLRIANRYDEDNKKRSNPERDDYVGVDRRYVEIHSQMIYWDSYRDYIKAIAIGAENAFSAVSRRITQRGQDLERERRNQGVNTTNITPQGPIFGRRQ